MNLDHESHVGMTTAILQKITNDILRLSAEWDNLRVLPIRSTPTYYRYVSYEKITQIREGDRTMHSFVWRGQAIFMIRMSYAGRDDFIGIAHYSIPEETDDIERHVLETDAPIEWWNIL